MIDIYNSKGSLYRGDYSKYKQLVEKINNNEPTKSK